nr:cytochrome C [Desulfobacterales bacterium]
MSKKRERVLAFSFVVIMFLFGVAGYARKERVPERPVRIMFKTKAGKVQFDHKAHLDERGYGFDCADCHHNLEQGETSPPACGECHGDEGNDIPKLEDALHMQCRGCHEENDSGPVDCSSCHII